MLCADVIEIWWKGVDGKRRKTSALLEDISVSGACLQTEIPIPVGATIHWRAPRQPATHHSKTEFCGLVRYCEYREIGYFVGVQFDPASKWSKKAYEPQHLLDLERLMPPSVH